SLAPPIDASSLEISVLPSGSAHANPSDVAGGSVDSGFIAFAGYKAATSPETLWLRLRARTPFHPGGIPVLIARGGWFEQIEAFSAPGGTIQHATDLREFGGAHKSIFTLPNGLNAGQSLYLRVTTRDDGADSLRFSLGTLSESLAHGAAHARMIALAVGALTSLALGSLLIWFILKDRLFILYTAMFLLEAVYLVFFSGEGFDWPVLSQARGVGAYMWNVPV